MRTLPDMRRPADPARRYDWRYFDNQYRIIYATDQQYVLHSGTIIVSRTNAQGLITHANRAFVETSGYAEMELLGAPHYILRHPDMPKEPFRELWETVKSGKEWHGYIKNLRKDGSYYWVYATVAPIVRDGRMIGCTSVRRKVDERIIAQYELYYRRMKQEENERDQGELQAGFFSKIFGRKSS